MVTSAMGDTTDDLLELAAKITGKPPAREMDMLLSTGEQVSVALMAMAIHSLGHKAVSLTGAQIGVKTDNSFRKARIRSIETIAIEPTGWTPTVGETYRVRVAVPGREAVVYDVQVVGCGS